MKKKTIKIVYTALFSALIFVGTLFIQLPLPFGYFNFGDCFILLYTYILGFPFSIIASALGSGLADVLSGYTLYLPATLIIKAIMTLPLFLFTRSKKSSPFILAISFILAESIMAAGYFLYETILYGVAGATASLSGNFFQGAVAVVASTLFVAIIEHSGLKKYIQK